MEIKSKFNILDKVYIIDLFKGKWHVAPYTLDFTICEIIVRYEGIYYRTDYSIYSEKDCFWTEKEAMVECEKRNKELAKILSKGE